MALPSIKWIARVPWLLSRQFKRLDEQHTKAQLSDFTEQHQKLLTLIQDQGAAYAPMPERKIPGWVADIGYICRAGIGRAA